MTRLGIPGTIGVAALALFAVGAFSPAADVLNDWISAPSQPGPADAIVVLAGGGASSLHRTIRGVVLYRKGLAPLVVLSETREDELPPDGEPRSDVARDLGVPAHAILTLSGHTTREEALRIAGLLRPRGARRILLVTGAQHIVRAKRLFEHAGFEVLAVPADTLAPSGPEARFKLIRRASQEIVAILLYRALGYF